MDGNVGGFTGNLSPDAVQTSIDAALYEEYQRAMNPGYVSAQDSLFYHQGTTDGKRAFIFDEYSGVPNFQITREQEDLNNTNVLIANKTTVQSIKYTSQVPISDEAFRADQVGLRAEIGRSQGDAARRTQDANAVLNTYGDAFAGAINTTPDGQPLASASHLTLTGYTVSTLNTPTLTPDSMWTLTVALASQQGQHGDLGGHYLQGALVPFTLYKTAKEVLNSTLLANSTENNLNVFDTDYGEVRIGASQFLGSQYNSNSNANTSWHIVSQNHFIMRKVFYDVNSVMIPPEHTSNDTYLLRVKYHEVPFPGSWTGYEGSSGQTAG